MHQSLLRTFLKENIGDDSVRWISSWWQSIVRCTETKRKTIIIIPDVDSRQWRKMKWKTLMTLYFEFTLHCSSEKSLNARMLCICVSWFSFFVFQQSLWKSRWLFGSWWTTVTNFSTITRFKRKCQNHRVHPLVWQQIETRSKRWWKVSF